MKRLRPYLLLLCASLLAGCANIGSPDGGPYDETPPSVVGTTPRQNATGVHSQRISLLFDELIRLTNASEKVVISPPQLEQPDIRTSGRRINIQLKDSLRAGTTYTIDFGNAIEDNTEGNPMGQYAFVFSTGEKIDSMEVAGKVLEAKNLEPVKGILVGLHSDLSDSAFCKKPLERVARTDGSGRFTIKGVAPGKYRVYALDDADGDYAFTQKSEKIAFLKDVIVPSSTPATRNDTAWADSTHIDSIALVHYTRYLPDDLVLRAFDEENATRHLLKTERNEGTHFTLYFTAPSSERPRVHGLNFNADGAFLVDASAGNDTLTYWLRSPELVRQDTLEMALTYLESDDSTGVMTERTDTLEMVARTPYSRVEKDLQDEIEKWEKQKERAEKRNRPFNLPRPLRRVKMRYPAVSSLSPSENISFTFDQPLGHIDTTRIHLQLRIDSTYHDRPYILRRDSISLLRYTLYGEWRPGQSYRLQIDTGAVHSIYGRPNAKLELTFAIPGTESYASFFVNLSNIDGGDAYVQLLSASDKVVRQAKAVNGHADFFFLKAGSYYMRVFVDQNGNGQWDTGLYATGLQPEPVYYYPAEIKLKANWDIEQDWNVRDLPLTGQKPMKITKQKPDKERTIQNRNAERERKKKK